MQTYTDKINWQNLADALSIKVDEITYAIDSKLVSIRKHPTWPLYILNYTTTCQISNDWNRFTIAARGLIVNEGGNIVARPFKKFFNLDQYQNIRNNVHHLYGVKYKDMFDGPFTLTEKMDGSLGILYNYGDHTCIASRGSFDSDQAKKANEIWQRKYLEHYHTIRNVTIILGVTLLFEIIYPDNQVVVDYGDMEDLVLIGAVNNKTGLDDTRTLTYLKEQNIFPSAKQIITDKPLTKLVELEQSNSEGFVALFGNGMRAKIKFAEYVRLHKILTGINERHIWEWLHNGDDWRSHLKNVPDEFFSWVEGVVKKLTLRYNAIESQVKEIIQKEIVSRKVPLTRKQIAEKYAQWSYRPIMFAILDNKEYKLTIWRFVREELL